MHLRSTVACYYWYQVEPAVENATVLLTAQTAIRLEKSGVSQARKPLDSLDCTIICQAVVYVSKKFIGLQPI